MRSRKTSASSKSDVGYRRPPKATRFKKGKSGNPRGRPKGSRDIGNVLLDVTRQKIPVTENGRTRRMPALEVMLRRLTNEAIQNDQGALKLLFTLMERYADLTETTIVPKRDEVLAEDQEILERISKNLRQRLQTQRKSLTTRRTEMQFDRRLYQALLRSDFTAFLEKSFRTLSPGDQYVWNWHIGAIAWHLERVRRGEIKRLIINMPPRSLKSLTASVAWPAFILGLDPSQRIICVSYSGELARKFSNDFRALIDAPFYKSLFPWTRVGRFKDSEVETEFTARGHRLATSVGGTLTGRGGDIIIIDDPLKPDDALSETKRSAANQWFTNTLLSRLDDKRTGAIVVVMQRVHMDDLTGFLLNQSDEWTVLSLPAVADYEQVIPISDAGVYRRKVGEALSPEREPLDVLDNIKLQIGSDAFSAQYQQSPVPPGGMMVQRTWIKRYSEWPPDSERFLIMQSWDTASKGGPNNDWSVCTTWIMTRKQQWYLIDVWRQRVDYPTLKANVQALAKQFRARRVLVEDTGAGIGLVQELKSHVPGIIAVKPEGDKASRMAIASAKFEAGQVFLPEQAPWLPDLEAELFAFPGSRYDDQCDSISQALSNSNNNYSFWELLSPEDRQRLLTKASKRRRRTFYGIGLSRGYCRF